MIRSADNANVTVRRVDYAAASAKHETVFSEPAGSFPFLRQAPAQLPLAFDTAKKTLFFFMKHTSKQGKIYSLSLAGWSTGSTCRGCLYNI